MLAGSYGPRQNYDIAATALGITQCRRFVIAVGFHHAHILDTNAVTDIRQEIRIREGNVSILACHPQSSEDVAVASGSTVSIYHLPADGGKPTLTTGNVTYSIVTDLSWNPFDANLLAVSSREDSATIRDVRDVLRKTVAEFGDQNNGMSQLKYSPYVEHLLLSAERERVYVWDSRKLSKPISHFRAHNGQITCLKWCPRSRQTFFTSATDQLFRSWNLLDTNNDVLAVPIVEERDLNCWQFWFSPDGEEYAVLTSPIAEPNPGGLSVYQYPFQENLNALFVDNNETIFDVAWQWIPEKRSKFVWAIKQMRGLIKQPIVYDYSSLQTTEQMPQPIAQSAMDEELDKVVGVSSTGRRKRNSTGLTSGDSEDFDIDPGGLSTLTNQVFFDESEILPHHKKNSSTDVKIGHEVWICVPSREKTPNLLTELSAALYTTARGITMTESNFMRAAMAFSYHHYTGCKPLQFELRFHRDFCENGNVLVKLLKQDCPISERRSKKLLEAIRQTAYNINKHDPTDSDGGEHGDALTDSAITTNTNEYPRTMLVRVLERIYDIVLKLNLFASPFVDILPGVSGTSVLHREHYLSDATKTTSVQDDLDSDAGSEGSLRHSTSLSYISSPYDEFVPAPRTCGAQFDASGYLVLFGNFRASYRFTYKTGECEKPNVKLEYQLLEPPKDDGPISNVVEKVDFSNVKFVNPYRCDLESKEYIDSDDEIIDEVSFLKTSWKTGEEPERGGDGNSTSSDGLIKDVTLPPNPTINEILQRPFIPTEPKIQTRDSKLDLPKADFDEDYEHDTEDEEDDDILDPNLYFGSDTSLSSIDREHERMNRFKRILSKTNGKIVKKIRELEDTVKKMGEEKENLKHFITELDETDEKEKQAVRIAAKEKIAKRKSQKAAADAAAKAKAKEVEDSVVPPEDPVQPAKQVATPPAAENVTKKPPDAKKNVSINIDKNVFYDPPPRYPSSEKVDEQDEGQIPQEIPWLSNEDDEEDENGEDGSATDEAGYVEEDGEDEFLAEDAYVDMGGLTTKFRRERTFSENSSADEDFSVADQNRRWISKSRKFTIPCQIFEPFGNRRRQVVDNPSMEIMDEFLGQYVRTNSPTPGETPDSQSGEEEGRSTEAEDDEPTPGLPGAGVDDELSNSVYVDSDSDSRREDMSSLVDSDATDLESTNSGDEKSPQNTTAFRYMTDSLASDSDETTANDPSTQSLEAALRFWVEKRSHQVQKSNSDKFFDLPSEKTSRKQFLLDSRKKKTRGFVKQDEEKLQEKSNVLDDGKRIVELPNASNDGNNDSGGSTSSFELEFDEAVIDDRSKAPTYSVLRTAPKDSIFPFGDAKTQPKTLVDYIEMMRPILKEIMDSKQPISSPPPEICSPDYTPRGDPLPPHLNLSFSTSPTAASIILQRNNPSGRLLSSSPPYVRGGPVPPATSSGRIRAGSLTLTEMITGIDASSTEALISTPVELFDVSYFLPISRRAAKGFRLMGASQKKLLHNNKKQVEFSGRPDVIEAWAKVGDRLRAVWGAATPPPKPTCTARCTKDCPTIFWKDHQKQKFLEAEQVEAAMEPKRKIPVELTSYTFNVEFFTELLNHHLTYGDIQTVAVVTACLTDVRSIRVIQPSAKHTAWSHWLPRSELAASVHHYQHMKERQTALARIEGAISNAHTSAGYASPCALLPRISGSVQSSNKEKRSLSCDEIAVQATKCGEANEVLLSRKKRLASILGDWITRNTIHGYSSASSLSSNNANAGANNVREENNFQHLCRLASDFRQRSSSITDAVHAVPGGVLSSVSEVDSTLELDTAASAAGEFDDVTARSSSSSFDHPEGSKKSNSNSRSSSSTSEISETSDVRLETATEPSTASEASSKRVRKRNLSEDEYRSSMSQTPTRNMSESSKAASASQTLSDASDGALSGIQGLSSRTSSSTPDLESESEPKDGDSSQNPEAPGDNASTKSILNFQKSDDANIYISDSDDGVLVFEAPSEPEFDIPTKNEDSTESKSSQSPSPQPDVDADADHDVDPNDHAPLMTARVFEHFEDVRIEYAEILARWRYYRKSAEIFKFCPSVQRHPIFGLISCYNCGHIGKTTQCDKCRYTALYCSICEMPCRGMTMTCPKCSHGGHSVHMKAWFKEHTSCPMACGCVCPF